MASNIFEDAQAAVSGAVQDVEISIDDVQAIASNMSGSLNTAGDAHKSVGQATAPASHFGGFPFSGALATQHGAVHGVFDSTVGAVLEDLHVFQQNLRASANAHQATDDNSATGLQNVGGGALAAFGNSMHGYRYKSASAYNHARTNNTGLEGEHQNTTRSNAAAAGQQNTTGGSGSSGRGF